MARKSATREVENEIFNLLKFSDEQRNEARASIEYEKSNSFGHGNATIPVSEQAATIRKFGMGGNIDNLRDEQVSIHNKLN